MNRGLPSCFGFHAYRHRLSTSTFAIFLSLPFSGVVVSVAASSLSSTRSICPCCLVDLSSSYLSSLSLPPPAVFFIFIFYPLLGCWLCIPHLSPSRYVLCAFFTFTFNSANLLYSALHAISLLLVLRACCMSGSVHLSTVYPHSLLSPTTPQTLNQPLLRHRLPAPRHQPVGGVIVWSIA